jgi:hypothetical protein
MDVTALLTKVTRA